MTPTKASYCIIPSTVKEGSQSVRDGVSALASAVHSFLRSAGLTEGASGSEVQLLVLLPRHSDNLTVEDALYLLTNAKAQRILLIDVADQVGRPHSALVPWLMVVSLSTLNVPTLTSWLATIEVRVNPQALASSDDLRRQIGRQLGNGVGTEDVATCQTLFDAHLHRVVKSGVIGTKTTASLLHTKSVLDFYFGLDHGQTCDYPCRV